MARRHRPTRKPVAAAEVLCPAMWTWVQEVGGAFNDASSDVATIAGSQERHQARTLQVIVRVERVIDLPKPEVAGLDEDGTLVAGFRQVPSCQHAVKDVDDGSARFNG